jgi:vacuolar-type H+-ATPase subunit I/STV1
MYANQQPQHPEVRAVLSEILTFAGQMKEMTALFASAHADMTRQLAATSARLDKAVETVAMGEARIAAQITSFDRMADGLRRAHEAQERDMQEFAGRIQQTMAEHAADSMAPLRNQVDGVLQELAAAQDGINAARAEVSASLEATVHTLDAKAVDLIASQSETLASRLGEVIQGSEASLAAAREAIDHSAGALAHRIWATAEAQDTKLKAFNELNTRLETLCTAVPDAASLGGRDIEMAHRMDETSKALNLAASKIVGAVIDLQAVKRKADNTETGLVERIDVLSSQQAEIASALGGLAGLLDSLVMRTVEERSEAVTEMLDRMDQLRDSVEAVQGSLETKAADEPAPALKAAHGRLSAALVGTKFGDPLNREGEGGGGRREAFSSRAA